MIFLHLILFIIPLSIGDSYSLIEADHECHDCRTIIVNVTANCPLVGYDCSNGDQITVSNPPESGNSKHCARLECLDKKAFLSIERSPTKSVECKKRRWYVKPQDMKRVRSATCAKRCDVGVCKATHPTNIDYKEMNVARADTLSRCAVGSCKTGLVSLNEDGTVGGEIEGDLICTGDGLWKDKNNATYEYAACRKKCSPVAVDVAQCLKYFDFLNDPSYAEQVCVATTVTSSSVECPTNTSRIFISDNVNNELLEEKQAISMRCNGITGEWSLLYEFNVTKPLGWDVHPPLRVYCYDYKDW